MPDALSPDLLHKMDAYWRASNYLSVGQIYLRENALLDVPLTRSPKPTSLLPAKDNWTVKRCTANSFTVSAGGQPVSACR